MSLFSIGYATKPLTTFIEHLHTHEITAIADVRSVPYSAVFKEYHREPLQAALQQAGIHYVYLGAELGPRSKLDAHYDETGQVQFARLMQSELFLAGISRLRNGLEKDLRIAMLCACKDSAICHRSLLVSYYLKHQCDIEVQHINHEGQLESESELEQRLISLQNLEADLLTANEDLAALAYERQVQQRAYRRPQD
ncbi:MAG: DUF488 domain-containing protein [Pseudomonadota bacterium]